MTIKQVTRLLMEVFGRENGRGKIPTPPPSKKIRQKKNRRLTSPPKYFQSKPFQSKPL